MDRDLLSTVLGRRIWPRALRRARLRGYLRRAIRGAGYPIVQRQRGASVSGIILAGATSAERRRLCAYEGDRYQLACALAELPHRHRLPVFLFTPRGGTYNVSNRPWSFAGWRLRYKRLAMKAVAVVACRVCVDGPVGARGWEKEIAMRCGCGRVSGLCVAAGGRWPRWVP